MAKSKPALDPLKSPAKPSTTSLDDDLDPADSGTPPTPSASGQSSDELFPCIFHLYFENCGNVDCKFSHSAKSIASRPLSRSSTPFSDGLPRSPLKKSVFHSHKPQPCRYFLKGICRSGNRCKDLHERQTPKSNSDGPWRGTGGRGGGTARARGQGRLKESERVIKSGTNTILVVQENHILAEERNAHIEEIVDDVGDDNDDRGSRNSPRIYSVNQLDNPPETSPEPAFPEDNGEVENRVQLHDEPKPNVDGPHGLDTGVDEWDSGLDHARPGVVEKGTTQMPADRALGDEGDGADDDDEDDKWGWNEVSKRKQEVTERAQNQERWTFRELRREEVGFEADELEYASKEDDGVIEEGPAEGGIDPSWNQPPEDDKIQGEIETCTHADKEWEGAAEQAEEAEGPTTANSAYDAYNPEQEQVEEPDAGDKIWDAPNPMPELKDSEPIPIEMSADALCQTPVPRPPSLPPYIQTRSPTTSTQPTTLPAPASAAPVPSADVRQTSMMSLHWCRFADPSTDPSIAFCKAFAQNKCSNTASYTCTFRHCLTPQEYTLLFKDPQPLQFSLQKNLIRNDSPENTTLITSPSFILHWSHFADPTCDPKIAFCKPYAEHMCSDDDACTFRHCLTLEEYTLLFKDPQPNLIAAGRASATAQGQLTGPQNGQTTQRSPCIFYRKGNCKNGANCLYSHDSPPSTCPNIQSHGYCHGHGCSVCSTTTPTLNHVPPVLTKKPCQFWPRGTCKNGDDCPFAHVGESGAASQSAGNNETWGVGLAEDNQAGAWGANNGDVNDWDNVAGGNWANEGANNNNYDEDKGKTNEQEVDVGRNDQNQGTGWGDQNNKDGGWDNQNNDNDGWGDQPNNSSGWDDGKAGGSVQNNRKNDSGEQNNDTSNYMTNNGRQRQDGRRDNTGYNNKRNNRDSWYRGGPSGGKGQPVCNRFRQGRCSYGPDCRFSHDLEPGGSSGHGSRDVSQPLQRRSEPPPAPVEEPAGGDPVVPTPAPRATSTYGGRIQYDRGYINEWTRDVAASSAGSEAGGSRRRNSSSRGRGHGRTNDSNRSVERPPTGNDPCQFYLVGRCSIGDTCPSSHDPVAPIGIEGRAIQQGVEEEGELVAREVLIYEATLLGGDVGERGEEDKEAPDREVEGVALDDDINANNVVDSKWGRDDQWDDHPAEVPEEEIRINKPCLHYGQGFCEAGEYCRFLHIEPEQPSPERSVKGNEQVLADRENEDAQNVSEPGTRDHVSDIGPQAEITTLDYGHPLVERSIFGCAVLFGPDCLPDKITTGTDSHVLLLEGPSDITETGVHNFVNKYGPVKDIIITEGQPNSPDGSEEIEQDNGQDDAENAGPPSTKSAIRVEFKEMKDAAAAARGLHAPLADAVPIESAPFTSTWVRFRWPQATRAAWIHYSSITKAKTMAEKLQSTVFQSRKITASFLRPDKRQKDLYAIKLERLPADTTRGDLVELGEDSKLITISDLTYNDNPREMLQQFAGVKGFVDVPEDPTKIHAVAFARLDSEESMFRALQRHEAKPKFLGKQELLVQRVWFAHYELPKKAFKSVATEVAALQIRYEGGVQVNSCDFGDHYMIYLHAPHEEVDLFAKANLSLQAICRGMIVMDPDNQPEWDNYLYSPSSAKVVENLNSKNNFYIFSNLSARRIHVLGSGIDQDKGVLMVKKLLHKVRGSYQEYPVHRNVLRQLTNGGLSDIQGDVGSTKLSLDVLRSVLVVRGGDPALAQKIHHLLDSSSSKRSHEESDYSNHLCSVCESRPGGSDSNPIIRLSCGHVYCPTCLQYALVSAAHDHSAPVRCIGWIPAGNPVERVDTCGQSIAYTMTRDLLPLATEPEYLKATLSYFIHSNLDEYFFCPSLRCDAVYRRGERGDNIRCPICRAYICLFCGSPTHDGIACDDAQEARATICT